MDDTYLDFTAIDKSRYMEMIQFAYDRTITGNGFKGSEMVEFFHRQEHEHSKWLVETCIPDRDPNLINYGTGDEGPTWMLKPEHIWGYVNFRAYKEARLHATVAQGISAVAVIISVLVGIATFS